MNLPCVQTFLILVAYVYVVYGEIVAEKSIDEDNGLAADEGKEISNEIVRCGSSDPKDLSEYLRSQRDFIAYKKKLQMGEATRRKAGSVEVDVYVHIITDANGKGDISDNVIRKQMEFLNKGFEGKDTNTCGKGNGSPVITSFRFVLKGITRTANKKWFVASDTGSAQNEMKKKLRVGGCSDLNMYFNNVANGDFLGYATFPTDCKHWTWDDGVVNHYGTVPGGNFSPYNEGDTAVHEVGHWLGLEHTFLGGCGGQGDGIDDTPRQKKETSGCPSNRDTCPNHAGKDPIHNFMDYSDDCCMSEFTPDQSDRMNMLWEKYRGGPIAPTPTAPTPTAPTPTAPTPTSGCIPFVIDMKLDGYGDEIKWKIYKDGKIIKKSPNYFAAEKVDKEFCLPDACYKFTITDTYGDGLGNKSNAYYKIYWNGKLIKNGKNFGFSETTNFGCDDTPNTNGPCVQKKCKKKSWKILCSKFRKHCRGCPQCENITFPCKNKCTWMNQSWKKKCDNPQTCAGCPKCETV